jgi:hypothetical protein
MIAVIIPDIANPFYTALARGLADAVDDAGYGTYVCNTDGLLEREQKFIQDVLDRGVDGVAMASVHVATELVSEAVRLGTPFVCLGGSIDHPEVDVVTADDEEGARLATSYLIMRGARRPAMISGAVDSGIARDEGYRRALQAAGLEVTARRHEGVEPGARVSVMIRPERLEFVGGGATHDNQVPGVIRHRVFLGDSFRFQVELEGGGEVTVKRPITEGRDQGKGAAVTLGWWTESSVALAQIPH